MISYFTGEHTGRMYIFVITQKGCKVINVAKQSEFEKYITGLRNAIKYNAPEVFSETSYMLYSQLFPKKIASQIKKLIIIPDGKLGTIPFEAFIYKKINPNYLMSHY